MQLYPSINSNGAAIQCFLANWWSNLGRLLVAGSGIGQDWTVGPEQI